MLMKDRKDRPTAWDEVVNIQDRLTSMALDHLLERMANHREG